MPGGKLLGPLGAAGRDDDLIGTPPCRSDQPRGKDLPELAATQDRQGIETVVHVPDYRDAPGAAAPSYSSWSRHHS